MNTPTTPTRPPAAAGSSGARALALLLVGLLLGAMLTVTLLRSSSQGARYPQGLMAVLQYDYEQLRRQARQPTCDLAGAERARARIVLLAADIPSALRNQGSAVRSMTDDLLAASSTPLAACDVLSQAVRRIDDACRACHTQLR